MSSNKTLIIDCFDHNARLRKEDGKCSLCYGGEKMRLQNMKNVDGSFWEIYVPSILSEDEAQKEYQQGIDSMLNHFKLSN